MKSLFWLCLLLSLCVLPALAQTSVPDPAQCETTLDTTQRLYLCPDENFGACINTTFEVIVRDNLGNPFANAYVEVVIHGLSTGHLRLCADQELDGTTDANGWIEMSISGGGCHKGDDVCEIRANGVIIRQYDAVMSADYGSWDNEGIPDRSDLRVDPIDVAAFVRAYQGGTGPPSCHDYDNNGVTAPPDLGAFVQAYIGGVRYCDPDR